MCRTPGRLQKWDILGVFWNWGVLLLLCCSGFCRIVGLEGCFHVDIAFICGVSRYIRYPGTLPRMS